MATAYDVDALVEDLTFLAEVGTGITEAAHRTGFASADSLDRWLRRHDQAQLVTRLTAREPVALVPSRKAR